jgi:hypothetical protein
MTEFISNLSSRDAALMAAAAAAVHAIHLAWPNIKASAAACARAYPWLAANGGVGGVIKTLAVGKTQTPALPAEKKEETHAL